MSGTFLFPRADGGYEDHGPAIIGVSIGLLGVAAILVIIRWSYRIGSLTLGMDDWLILGSVLLSLGHTIVDVFSVYKFGYGKHKVDLTPAQASAPGSQLGFWLAQIFYKLAVATTKLSICLLYHRIFERSSRAFGIALWGTFSLIALYYTAAIIATIFQCVPVDKTWIKSKPGTCINTNTFFYANAGFNIATDFMIMFLPLPVIYALHLPIRQRIILSLAFGIGIVATATSIIRLFTLNTATQGIDPTWDIAYSVIWSSAEMNTAIICACLPIMKAPLRALFPRLFTTYGSNQRSKRSNVNANGYFEGPKSNVSRSRTVVQGGWSKTVSKDGTLEDAVGLKELERRESDHSLSDRFIFREDEEGIRKVTDFSIMYEQNDARDSLRAVKQPGPKGM